jgi:hypothetical protein
MNVTTVIPDDLWLRYCQPLGAKETIVRNIENCHGSSIYPWWGTRYHIMCSRWLFMDHRQCWIYLLPLTQQTIGCNGFYNDMFRLTRIIVRLCSEPFGFSMIVTYSSGGCWSVWSGGGYLYTDMNEILRCISRNEKVIMNIKQFLVTFLDICLKISFMSV